MNILYICNNKVEPYLWGLGDCDTVFKNVSLGEFSNFIGKSNFASHALQDSVMLHDEA